MTTAGYKKRAFIALPSGGVAMTDEPMTRRAGTQVCFTTDPVKNVWSPLAADAVVIEDNGVVVDPENRRIVQVIR